MWEREAQVSSWESGVEFAISVAIATEASSEALTMSLLRGFKHRQRLRLDVSSGTHWEKHGFLKKAAVTTSLSGLGGSTNRTTCFSIRVLSLSFCKSVRSCCLRTSSSATETRSLLFSARYLRAWSSSEAKHHLFPGQPRPPAHNTPPFSIKRCFMSSYCAVEETERQTPHADAA